MNANLKNTKGNILSNGLKYAALTMVAVGLLTYCSPELFNMLPQHYDVDEIPYQKATLEEINKHFEDYKEQPVEVTIIPHRSWYTHTDKPAILQGSGVIPSESIVVTSDPTKGVRLDAVFNAYQNTPVYAAHNKTLTKLCDEKISFTIRGYVHPQKLQMLDEYILGKGMKKVFIITINAQDITYMFNGTEKQLSIATDSDAINKAILHLDFDKNRDKLE